MRGRSIAHLVFIIITLTLQFMKIINIYEAMTLHSLAYIGVNLSAIEENTRK